MKTNHLIGIITGLVLLIVSLGCGKPTDKQIQEAISQTQTAMAATPFQYHQTPGCTNKFAINYDQWATVNDGSCTYPNTPPSIIPGCMDTKADNYDQTATWMDGSCKYPPAPAGEIPGCTDPNSVAPNPAATWNDGSCVYKMVPVVGCTDENATNHVLAATVDDYSCVYPPIPVLGCTDPNASNYNPLATVNDYICKYSGTPVPGCTNPKADNFDPTATQDDGSCKFTPILGCTDPKATNFNSSANQDNGSCKYADVPATNLPGGCTKAEIKSEAVRAYIQAKNSENMNLSSPKAIVTFMNLMSTNFNALPQCVKNYLSPFQSAFINSLKLSADILAAGVSGDADAIMAAYNKAQASVAEVDAQVYLFTDLMNAAGQ